MKSICILLQNFYDIDIRVRRKAEALVAAGYSVDVLALGDGESKKHYEVNGVSVYTVSLGKQRGSLIRYAFEYIAFFLWATVKTVSLMHKKKYVLIDVNTLPDFLVFACLLPRWMGAKVILDMHEITPEFYMSKYGMKEESWPVRLLTYIEKISFDYADQVITINEPIQELLASRGLPPQKTTIVANSADESRFHEFRNVAISSRIPKSGKFVMMYHGTITKLYGLDIGIEAFSQVYAEMPDAELWILGDGTETEELKKLAQKRGLDSRVKFLGRVPPSEIPVWLERCSVGILPIRNDVFLQYASPNKLPEYIIMERPVIISRLRAIRQYFSENALAFCEPNDAQDLARQMVRLYNDNALRVSLVARAKKEYEPIRWEVMKQRYLSLVARMIGTAERSEKLAEALV